MLFSHLPAWLSDVFHRFASWLDHRIAFRLPLLLTGILFACGRRTATAWFRAAGITTEFRRAYHVIHAAGRHSTHLAISAWTTIQPCLAGQRRLTFAIDRSKGDAAQINKYNNLLSYKYLVFFI